MKTGVAPFQQHCEKTIAKLTPTDVENFKNIDDNLGRIRSVYDFAKDVSLADAIAGKNSAAALEGKALGNSHFAKKDFENALKAYSAAIISCPQNTDEEKELLTILISNRSAALFELRDYKGALEDIDYLSCLNRYPKQLMHKVWFRKARCHDFGEDHELAVEALGKTLDYLEVSDLDSKTQSKKREEVERLLKSRGLKGARVVSRTMEMGKKPDMFQSNLKFPAAHFDVVFDEDKTQGRFARATEDISAGTALVKEKAHCAVVGAENALTNCHYCFLSTNRPVACENCSSAVFCSLVCLENASKGFHGVECSILPAIFKSGASINCSMALRIVTQKNLAFFLERRKTLDEYAKGRKLDEFRNKIYLSEDYDTVYFLCRNEEVGRREQLLHYACMAIFLLRLLKRTGYFCCDCDDDRLSEDEAFIGSLILRHLQILQFNAHEISELRSSGDSGYTSEFVGGGLYPTLALFNHSCDPSVIRYNVGTKMIALAIKPIKTGEIIYENYGPLYTTTAKDQRQATLKERYWFECLCKPCVELWPTVDEMNDEILRLPCKRPKCPKVFEVKRDLESPFFKCNYCKENTSVFPYLQALMGLETLMPEAEEFFKDGDLEAAVEKFLTALSVYYKYTAPPCVDLVKIQQRLRTCLIHSGNKSARYSGFKA